MRHTWLNRKKLIIMITEADRLEAEKILLTVDGRGQTAKREALKLLLENEREMVMSSIADDRALIAANVIKLEAAIKDLAIDIHNGIIRK